MLGHCSLQHKQVQFSGTGYWPIVQPRLRFNDTIPPIFYRTKWYTLEHIYLSNIQQAHINVSLFIFFTSVPLPISHIYLQFRTNTSCTVLLGMCEDRGYSLVGSVCAWIYEHNHKNLCTHPHCHLTEPSLWAALCIVFSFTCSQIAIWLATHPPTPQEAQPGIRCVVCVRAVV